MTTNNNSTTNTTTAATWTGSGLTQSDLMTKDTVLVLDEADNVIGSASKKESHVFDATTNTQRGILHRAFSVFLFNERGELLLQQRAASKITFPNVWTNTCCSHPLHGLEPGEVDGPQDVQDGSVMGVKHAAVRKLWHELGIPAEQVPIEKFKFLTRLHYWAADTVTHGKESPWGEHEIDYVLFIQVEQSKLTINPHPDEVDAIKWVSKEQLIEEMKVGLWSPWFRLIVNKWVIPVWWNDLKMTLETDVHCDYENIHRFDPPEEHMGGGGNAGPWLGKLEM